ncbi:MAG: hypothetical protein A3F16_02555 [Deltaproteobacteria bacterium RIFCSPHIGHO2_12_FULL_43_9]|nr:MAG: hypothetical protein A3F16_02555 [Deltaproteobacteria bacterium RIFCSPHIGHO2_12_FULL_43_9]
MNSHEKGQSVVEYILMLAAVAAIIVATLPFIRGIFWERNEGDVGILTQTTDKLSEEHLQNGSWQ